MQQRTLGTSGPQLSVIGLGCNNFGMRIDAATSAAVVGAALDAGITYFDTAEMYGGVLGNGEEYLGKALGSRRSQVKIGTKYSPRDNDTEYVPGALAKRIREALDQSLRRLGTDYIDLYYQHLYDDDAPIEECLETLDELVKSGKVLHVANSNDSGPQITEADVTAKKNGWTPFCGTQTQWSVLERKVEQDIIPAVTAAGIGVVPYYPLASGLLTGKYRRGKGFPEGSRLAWSKYLSAWATDAAFDKIEALERFAAERGHTITQLAIAWLIAQPAVTSVIVGATKPEQLIDNVTALDWAMSAADAAAIAAL